MRITRDTDGDIMPTPAQIVVALALAAVIVGLAYLAQAWPGVVSAVKGWIR